MEERKKMIILKMESDEDRIEKGTSKEFQAR